MQGTFAHGMMGYNCIELQGRCLQLENKWTYIQLLWSGFAQVHMYPHLMDAIRVMSLLVWVQELPSSCVWLHLDKLV